MSFLKRLVPIVLALTVVAYSVAVTSLSRANQHPGSPDAKTTLHLARNIVTGKGFVNDIVCQHAQVYPIPHDPTHRKPGAPFLMAAAFKVMGVKTAAPVVLNGVLLLGLCATLWWALAWAGLPVWYKGLGALLLLVSHNYELVSFWNTGSLSICATGLLALMAGRITGRVSARSFILWSAVIGAMGFYLKPTFIITLGACALFALSLEEEGGITLKSFWRGVSRTSVCTAIVVLLTAPYWLTNLLQHGTPLYSVQPLLRLSERYHLLPHGTFQTILYDAAPTYSSTIAQLGMSAFLKMELGIWQHGLKSALGINPVLWLLATVGTVLMLNRRNVAWFAIGLLGMTSTFLFPTFYFAIEDRYYWPMYPCLLFVVGIVVREFCVSIAAPGALSGVAAVLRPRMSILFLGTVILAAAYNIGYARPNWARWHEESTLSVPAWVSHVRALPDDVRVLTDDPWSLAWYANRAAVIVPRGAPDAVRAAIDYYGPSHILTIAHSAKELPFAPHELALIARGTESRGNWFLYALSSGEPSTESRLQP